jgi:hypothetical protein
MKLKTINLDLKYKTKHYLKSLTAELVENSNVKLIVAIQDASGHIDQCDISVAESNSTDDTILQLGMNIGAHAVYYKLDQTFQEFVEDLLKKRARIDQMCADVEQNQEGAPKGEDFVFEEDLFGQQKEEEEIVETKFRILLRGILRNFKK